MLKILIKKQLYEQYAGLFYDPKKNKARSKLATLGMILLTFVLALGVFGVLLTLLSLALCEPLCYAGMSWLYFAVMGMIALLLGVVGGAFAAYTHLYKSKDNDALLSLPIPARHIITARIISVFLTTGLYSLLALLPGLIVYWVLMGFSVPRFMAGLLFALSLACISLVLGCLLGFVVARVSTKLKNKSIITVLVSLLMLGLYYFFYFRFQKLLQNMSEDPESFRHLENVPGLKFFGQAGAGELLPSLLLAGVALILLGLTVYLLERSFRHVVSAADNVARVRYKERDARQKAPGRALLGKEWNRLISSPGYMLNGALGSVFLLLLAGVVLIKGPEFLGRLSDSGFLSKDQLAVILCAAIGFMGGTNILTPPSVSLEGKQLWIVKSLPLEARSILGAKLGLGLLVTGVPVLMASISSVIVLKPGPWLGLLMLVFPLLCVLLFTAFGLMAGLVRPNLSWTNEMIPVKQSLPAFLSMFGGMFYGVVLGVLFFLLAQKMGALWYLIIACLLTALLSLLILAWLKNRGVKRWENLS